MQHGCYSNGRGKSLTLTWEKFNVSATWYASCCPHNKVVSSRPVVRQQYPPGLSNQWLNRERDASSSSSSSSSSVVTDVSHCSGLCGEAVVSSSPSQTVVALKDLSSGSCLCFELRCIFPYPTQRFVREKTVRPTW